MVFIVILAGGGGERLWPISRKNRPKQCISIDGKRTLVQKTYDLAIQIAGEDRIMISTKEKLVPIIQEQLPSAKLLAEPLGRDSAAGIGFACIQLLKDEIDDPTVFMGADYHIPDISGFKAAIAAATYWAEKAKIVTIGITPTRIETRFGYINPGKLIYDKTAKVYESNGFMEKPTKSIAQEYISKGYLWNSGMFIAKPSVLYKNIKQYMPLLYQALETIKIANFDEKKTFNVFSSLSKISIDYGVMEKTSDLVVVKGEFIWDDIGAFDSLDRILKTDSEGNIIQSEFLGIDVKNSVIFGTKPVIAFGMSDLVVIDCEDCIFLCQKERASDIKKVIKAIESNNRLKRLLSF